MEQQKEERSGWGVGVGTGWGRRGVVVRKEDQGLGSRYHQHLHRQQQLLSRQNTQQSLFSPAPAPTRGPALGPEVEVVPVRAVLVLSYTSKLTTTDKPTGFTSTGAALAPPHPQQHSSTTYIIPPKTLARMTHVYTHSCDPKERARHCGTGTTHGLGLFNQRNTHLERGAFASRADTLPLLVVSPTAAATASATATASLGTGISQPRPILRAPLQVSPSCLALDDQYGELVLCPLPRGARHHASYTLRVFSDRALEVRRLGSRATRDGESPFQQAAAGPQPTGLCLLTRHTGNYWG